MKTPPACSIKAEARRNSRPRTYIPAARRTRKTFGKGVRYAAGYKIGRSLYESEEIIPQPILDSLRREAVEMAKTADVVIYIGGLNKKRIPRLRIQRPPRIQPAMEPGPHNRRTRGSQSQPRRCQYIGQRVCYAVARQGTCSDTELVSWHDDIPVDGRRDFRQGKSFGQASLLIPEAHRR